MPKHIEAVLTVTIGVVLVLAIIWTNGSLTKLWDDTCTCNAFHFEGAKLWKAVSVFT